MEKQLEIPSMTLLKDISEEVLQLDEKINQIKCVIRHI